MTQEEKAKAYDEAKARMSRAFNSNRCTIGFMNEIFPELCESKDERIRKELIEFVKSRGGFKQEYIAWLEKQGEQKPILDFKAKNWYVSKVDGKIHNLYHSVDEVKPKFKIGDWVISTLPGIKYPHLITDIKDGYYIFGEDDDHAHIASNDDVFKLWTIQDAKDGDILCTPNGNTFIFKTIDGDKILDYCGLYFNKFFSDSGSPNGSSTHYDKCNYHPATKEQRDLLFAKMKESGYEWDEENKELKKIEQKPTDKISPKFKVGDRIIKSSRNSCPVHSSTDDTICEVAEVHDTCYILNTKDGRIQVPLEWQDSYELVKPAWSEEDERNLNDAILFIETGTYSLDKDNLINWLKSLRPQPKQEWSEEDDWIKTKIIKVLLGCETFLTSEETNECIDWIKSIKQRLKGKS